MAKILVVEDEPDMREGLRYNLEFEGHEAVLVGDGYAGLEAARTAKPDLILLDLMLPGAQWPRDREAAPPGRDRIPVVILTARGQENDKVQGLELGADDYVTKPFSVRELLARIDAVLRRANGRGESEVPPRFHFADIEIDFERRVVTRASQPIQLSFKEFEIMRFFVRRQGQIVSRDELLDQVWGYPENAIPNTRTVDTHIAKLRRKLEGPAGRQFIRTVHKIGYRFTPEDEE